MHVKSNVKNIYIYILLPLSSIFFFFYDYKVSAGN